MIRSSQNPNIRRTFSSATYLEELMAELDRAAISVRLAKSREDADLTQPEMAEALQRHDEPLHWRTVQNYESPKNTRIPWDLLDQWAKITGVTKEWLLHGDQPAPEPATADEISRVRADVAELRETVDRILALLLGQDESRERPADP